MLNKRNLTIQPLTPLLQESGAAFELNVGKQAAGLGEQVVDMTDLPCEETVQKLRAVRNPTILQQPTLKGILGTAACSGRSGPAH